MANHLFAVVYIFGKVAATIGPWDDEAMDVCVQGGKELMERTDKVFQQHPVILSKDNLKVRRSDITTACEWHEKAPALGDLK